jgi:hypothetical protein
VTASVWTAVGAISAALGLVGLAGLGLLVQQAQVRRIAERGGRP